MSHTCSLTENKSGDTITYHVSCNPKHKANMSAPSEPNGASIAPSAPSEPNAPSASNGASITPRVLVSKPIASNAASRAPSHDAPKPLFNVRPHMLNHAPSAPSAPKKSGNKKKSQQAPINSATVSTAVSAPPPHDILDEEKRTLDAMIAEMQAYFQQNMKNKNKEEIKPLRKELNEFRSPRIKQQRDRVNVIIQNASSNPPAEIDLINKKITRVISEIHQLLNTVQGGRRTKKTRRKHTRRNHTRRKHTKTTRRMIFHR
jgi:hypothetical protein